MKTGIDKKWFVGTFIVVFLAGIGGVSAYYKDQENRDDAKEKKYATKEEAASIMQFLQYMKATQDEANKAFKQGLDQANDRLYDIQKDQVLVKVANDRLVKISRRLSVANDNVSDLKEQVQDQKVLVQKALDKKKK